MPQATTPLSHAGQRVLITAAASGIGLVTAQAFAAAGARVYICDIDAAALAETLLRHPQLERQRPQDLRQQPELRRTLQALRLPASTATAQKGSRRTETRTRHTPV